jgi:uncharacterized protein with GYD domain
MVRYALLLRYTEIGISQIQNTVGRAAVFRQTAAALGVTVESMFWTLGEYDGVLVLSAEGETSVIALVTELARRGYVRTHLLRAFLEDEFATILGRMPSAPVDLDE